ALGTTDLNGGALFNAEFGIRHRGSTVPERSGVALSFCRRQIYRNSRASLHRIRRRIAIKNLFTFKIK
ncbi:hypothetical protein CDO41_18545, partial [Pseudomonas aeruginosa]